MGEDRGGRHAAAVLVACVLWGTTGTVAHYAPPGSAAALIGLSTFGFGAVLLLAIDIRGVARLMRSGRRPWPALAAGAAGVVMYAAMYYPSMALVGVAIGNVLALGSGPVFAALLELLLDRRPIRPRWAAATAVAIVGICLLTLQAGRTPGPHPVAGVVLGLAAGFGYALYSYAGARLIGQGHPSRSVMAAIFAVAAIALLPWFFLAGPGPLVSTRGVLILAYLALLPMAAAYLLFGYGLRRLSASTATTLTLAEPVVATVLATTVLGERLTALSWAGLALILAGVVLVPLTPSRASPGDDQHRRRA